MGLFSKLFGKKKNHRQLTLVNSPKKNLKKGIRRVNHTCNHSQKEGRWYDRGR
jgi:hypothetical protein